MERVMEWRRVVGDDPVIVGGRISPETTLKLTQPNRGQMTRKPPVSARFIDCVGAPDALSTPPPSRLFASPDTILVNRSMVVMAPTLSAFRNAPVLVDLRP